MSEIERERTMRVLNSRNRSALFELEAIDRSRFAHSFSSFYRLRIANEQERQGDLNNSEPIVSLASNQ